MKIAEIIDEYYDAFLAKYQDEVLPGQLKALHAMRDCRTPDSGELYLRCSDCGHTDFHPLSCGNRNCPQCQNHETSQWIDRQQNKLLPVEYFMVTFTLPFEFRTVAYLNQKAVYSILFVCVSSTLKDFGLNPKNLGAEIGMTMVLHTHSRRLDFHPHIHVIVPGGGINRRRRQWIKKKREFLFDHRSLANVFRARFLDSLNRKGLTIPRGVRPEWVVDCAHVGKGITALKYLSRYLYRGVISEKNIVSNEKGQIKFRYIDSDTGETRYRKLSGEKFLRLILLHVLPQRFRRVRDYGFLHGRAKKLLFLVQLILYVQTKKNSTTPKASFKMSLVQVTDGGYRFSAGIHETWIVKDLAIDRP